MHPLIDTFSPNPLGAVLVCVGVCVCVLVFQAVLTLVKVDGTTREIAAKDFFKVLSPRLPPSPSACTTKP
jgi:hypothetical protein